MILYTNVSKHCSTENSIKFAKVNVPVIEQCPNMIETLIICIIPKKEGL